MVIGTGMNIVEVKRVKKATRKKSFMERVFTNNEREYFEKNQYDLQTIAGTFAAKEATAKALTVGFNTMRWKDIEILHDESGNPYAKLWNTAKSRLISLGGAEVHLNISLIKSLAVAQAIVEDSNPTL